MPKKMKFPVLDSLTERLDAIPSALWPRVVELGIREVEKEIAWRSASRYALLGIDEVGTNNPDRPLIVGGCVIQSAEAMSFLRDDLRIKDSKRLSEEQRRIVRDMILDRDDIWTATMAASPGDVSSWGLSRSLDHLCQKLIHRARREIRFDEVVIDGHPRKGVGYHHRGEVRGDERFEEVMVASIMARTELDDYSAALRDNARG